MGIASMITRNCKQTAVYWPVSGDDGYGSKIFADPYEILCRWEDKDQLIRLDDGNQISSRAVVYVLQDVDLEGMLYLGDLDNIDSGDYLDPKNVEGAYIIKKFEKSPLLGSITEFYRKALLTPLLT